MIIRAGKEHAGAIARLAVNMWEGHDVHALEAEFCALLARGDCSVFLYIIEDKPVGFAQCQLRRDYVEGTQTSPVGYLEGIFVDAGYRMRGIARELLSACQAWAKEMGCAEFASDCELHNEESLAFHLKMGFAEANRIICFTKKL